MKRERDDTEEEAPEAGSAEVPGDAPEASARGAASDPAPDGAEEEDDDDLEQFSAATTSSKAVRRGAECPYLDTISRQVSWEACAIEWGGWSRRGDWACGEQRVN